MIYTTWNSVLSSISHEAAEKLLKLLKCYISARLLRNMTQRTSYSEHIQALFLGSWITKHSQLPPPRFSVGPNGRNEPSKMNSMSVQPTYFFDWFILCIKMKGKFLVRIFPWKIIHSVFKLFFFLNSIPVSGKEELNMNFNSSSLDK